MTFLIFVIILAVLVLSHELGHFLVAKLFGIRVDEFGFGFPPKIFSRKYGETTYSLNLLPLGGFVKIFGEDPTHEVLDKNHVDFNRSLYHKPRYIQAAVIVAGVLFNLILGFAMLSGGFMAGLPVPAGFTELGPKPEDSKLIITGILKDSPAELAGLKTGYNIVFLSTKDSSIQIMDPEKVSEFISINKNKEVFVGYKIPLESGLLADIGLGPLDFKPETKTISIVPKEGIISGRAGIGISMDLVGILKLPFFQALYAGATGAYYLFTNTLSGLYQFVAGLFSGESVGMSVSGPVGLVGVVGSAAHFGLAYLLALTALISINLAVLNLVPFPALDGGRLFLILVESVIRKPLDPKIVNTLNVGGFVILLCLMIFVTYGDIVKLMS
ncbi:MAG: M50 family metallopeptidase [bacterium]|nr:M50 family metallopeptidase [bacterium]